MYFHVPSKQRNQIAAAVTCVHAQATRFPQTVLVRYTAHAHVNKNKHHEMDTLGWEIRYHIEVQQGGPHRYRLIYMCQKLVDQNNAAGQQLHLTSTAKATEKHHHSKYGWKQRRDNDTHITICIHLQRSKERKLTVRSLPATPLQQLQHTCNRKFNLY